MEPVVRTIYAAHLQTCKLLNKPFTLLPNSTLNQKFSSNASVQLASNEVPALRYLAIGNKGATYDLGTDNYVLTKPIDQLPRHASLYNHLPFVIRPTTNDLSNVERANYRMRVIKPVGGVNYIFYYLKVLDLTTTVGKVELRNINDGTITSVDFTPALSDLFPEAPVLSPIDINNPNGNYLVSSAKINFVLSQNDVTEIMNACNILYGDPRYAVINELALCTGVDKLLTGALGAGTVEYTDVIGCQIASFIGQYHALTSNTTSVTLEFDVGAIEPLAI